MAYQRLSAGFPFPVYINETSTAQRLTSGPNYVNETASINYQYSVSCSNIQAVKTFKTSNRALSSVNVEGVYVVYPRSLHINVNTLSATAIETNKFIVYAISLYETQAIALWKSVRRTIHAVQSQVNELFKITVQFIEVITIELVLQSHARAANVNSQVIQADSTLAFKVTNEMLTVTSIEVVEVLREKTYLITAKIVSNAIVIAAKTLVKSVTIAQSQTVNFIKNLHRIVSYAQSQVSNIAQAFNFAVSTIQIEVLNNTFEFVIPVAVQLVSFQSSIVSRIVFLTKNVSQSQIASIFKVYVLSIKTLINQVIFVAFKSPPLFIVESADAQDSTTANSTPLLPNPSIPQFLATQSWLESARTPVSVGGPIPPIPEFLGKRWWKKVHSPPNT